MLSFAISSPPKLELIQKKLIKTTDLFKKYTQVHKHSVKTFWDLRIYIIPSSQKKTTRFQYTVKKKVTANGQWIDKTFFLVDLPIYASVIQNVFALL